VGVSVDVTYGEGEGKAGLGQVGIDGNVLRWRVVEEKMTKYVRACYLRCYSTMY
jgi:hypothetical protein